MTDINYEEAIAYLVNNGFVYNAICDLSQSAQMLANDIQKKTDELNAEKRTVKKLLKSDLVTDQMILAISTLLEGES